MLKELLVRHFASAGFKRRFTNIYLPVIKQFLAYPYRAIHAKLEQNQFAEEYKIDRSIEDAEEAPDTATYNAEGIILTEENAVELLKRYQLNHEPQEFGTCVAHSMKNIHRFATKACFNDVPDFSEHDVYIDRETRGNDLDGGMYPSRTLQRMVEKGIAIKGVVPTALKTKDLNTTRADYPDALLAPFRVKMIKTHKSINAEGAFDLVWNYIVETYNKHGVRPFQFSITSRAGWWGSDVPEATGKTYGGHSAVGLTIPFMFGKKRAFFCIDSSYRRGTTWRVGTGIRIVTEDCWNGLGKIIRPLSFVDVIEKKLGTQIIEDPSVPNVPTLPNQPLLTVPAAMPQQNVHVEAIQKALIANGFDIPAITSGSTGYGYYGQQTADAVLAFHRKFSLAFTQLDPYWTLARLEALEGKSFGTLSIRVMNALNSTQ